MLNNIFQVSQFLAEHQIRKQW